MELTKTEPNFLALQLEAYLYHGCGDDHYVLIRRGNISHHLGDAYVCGGRPKSEHPWTTDLLGTTVRFSPDHMNHVFFDRYSGPTLKLFGDGYMLHCRTPGHNACLPDCTDDRLPCEFEDHFVHVDNFDEDWR